MASSSACLCAESARSYISKGGTRSPTVTTALVPGKRCYNEKRYNQPLRKIGLDALHTWPCGVGDYSRLLQSLPELGISDVSGSAIKLDTRFYYPSSFV